MSHFGSKCNWFLLNSAEEQQEQKKKDEQQTERLLSVNRAPNSMR